MQQRRSNTERSEETRAALIAAARRLFLEKGYAGTATPEVVAHAGLTRGALYHHFRDKQALFEEVVIAEAEAVAGEIAAAGSSTGQTPVERLIAGSRAYFRAMAAAGRVRLLLLEGPAVLGPEKMRGIDLETGGRELRTGLTESLGGDVSPSDVEVYADLISAMFDRAALAGAAGAGSANYEVAISGLLALLVERHPAA